MKKRGPVTKLKEEMAEKNSQIKELNDKYLRALADLDNYRKLMQKEMQGYRKYSKAEFFNKIIPVLDSFDRALNGVESDTDFEHFYKGVEIIYRQLTESLKSLGLIEFSGLGEEFDPSRHEAVATVETNDQPENMVVEEISKGYIVDDMIIKPAKVCVSKQVKGGQEDAQDNRN
jgi:molecular chaperone GrpE